jgi:hypothetical protein
MKIASFTCGALTSWGRLESECIIPVQESVRARFPTLGAALRHGYVCPAEIPLGPPLSLTNEDLFLSVPVGDPGKIEPSITSLDIHYLTMRQCATFSRCIR